MTVGEVEAVLGRPERPLPILDALAELELERILVTGAAGSLGAALVERLEVAAATDIDTLDVREPPLDRWQPTLVLHLAGAKHAPEGEQDPWGVCETNAVGTRNVLEAFPAARVVLASTCKACDPETAYGASKLIAERMVLNAGGSVARFYNIVESSGNVFETWAAVPPGEPLPVTVCSRYFMSMTEAVSLLLNAAVAAPGRYVFPVPFIRRIEDVAADLYPARDRDLIQPRRGDRRDEPRYALADRADPVGALERVTSPHDLAAALA